ncbi:carbon monoxide dehydrogenase [Carbonactinospora thermoautotrophica]|uniref:SRPBCC family protein n=1 Tax=Carbonactinospora thermoautotrophica TaxID=1469144 RepID=UPI00099E941E|nr:SRPBCC family protein [Carbonactinospora thermoautotrophica]MCX9192431.1 carbon monoxide dehydrogenase [Carbonactinospora thermoautotrophica]
MLIESEFEVAAPVEQVWKYMLDVPRMALCMPGAELTEVVDQDTYKGRVTTKLGPVSMRFAGVAHVVERDEPAKRIVVNATGSEEKGKGQAQMLVTATLIRAGRGTKVKVSQDLQISGAAAQFGRGMIQDVTNVLLGQFAANVQDDIGRWSRGEAPSARGEAPMKGLSVGLQAMLVALKRFFGRFFGGFGGGRQVSATTFQRRRTLT